MKHSFGFSIGTPRPVGSGVPFQTYNVTAMFNGRKYTLQFDFANGRFFVRNIFTANSVMLKRNSALFMKLIVASHDAPGFKTQDEVEARIKGGTL